jgi:FkbM family methyltransferase
MHEREAPPATCIAHGSLGPIEGLADDAIVFGRYAREGCYAPELVELLCALLGSSGTLLDVGAHIGLVSLAVAQRRPAARCLAFEPEPTNVELLRRNVARHARQDRVEVYACALDEQAGTRTLALSADNSGDHHLTRRGDADAAGGVERHDAGARRISVDARRLDDVLEGRALRAPWLLKLDTQGAEARVLRGATRTLPAIEHAVVEFWPYGQRRIGERPFALDALLCASFPYAAVIERGALPTRLQPTAVELERLRWIERDGSDPGFFDLLLSRRAEPLSAG